MTNILRWATDGLQIPGSGRQKCKFQIFNGSDGRKIKVFCINIQLIVPSKEHGMAAESSRTH
jgi:hypothetical protein